MSEQRMWRNKVAAECTSVWARAHTLLLYKTYIHTQEVPRMILYRTEKYMRQAYTAFIDGSISYDLLVGHTCVRSNVLIVLNIIFKVCSSS